jgi:hypothetical protein
MLFYKFSIIVKIKKKKSCQKAEKKLSKLLKTLSKNCQKIVKIVKNKCQKIVKKIGQKNKNQNQKKRKICYGEQKRRTLIMMNARHP